MIRTYRYASGTRIRVRGAAVGAGRFPMDPTLPGRTGLIVETDDYRPRRYGVVLDGEAESREFDEDELEPLTEAKPAGLAGDPGPTVAG